MGRLNISLAERILLRLSRSNDFVPERCHDDEDSFKDPIKILLREFPDFAALVKNKRVVDFGCGRGIQAVELVENFGCDVTGVDISALALGKARELASEKKIPENKLQFSDQITEDMQGKYDIVISQNSMEHFRDPEGVVKQMKSLLNPSGHLLITFGPPWYAPYGSHMRFFCRLPWLNIFFSEKTVMSVRSHFRSDGAMRYEDVESGLNKMTVKKFHRLVASCELREDYYRSRCVKGMDFLSKIPLIRELFINHITVILSKKS